MKKLLKPILLLSLFLGCLQLSHATEPKGNVRVTLKVPDPGWKVHIASMHVKEGKLLVICRASHGAGVHASMITEVTAKARVKKGLAALPREVYLIGRSWNWGDGYTAITEKDLPKIIEASEQVYSAPSEKAPQPEDFIGLTLEKAKTLAEQHKIEYRITMVDGQPRPATTDYRPHRYNFEVEKGKISRVIKG